MNPVLCVTEFTDLTTEAARTAAVFARAWGDPMVLVHSVDEREQFPFKLRERLIDPDWRRLTAEAQRLRQLGFEFEEQVVRGLPEDGIGAFAWRSGASLVVIGSKPTAQLEHWALGSMAEEISDTCLVPVLAVRSAAPFERWLASTAPLNVWVGLDPAARPDALLHRIDELRELGPCRISTTFVSYPENASDAPDFPTSSHGPHEFRSSSDSKDTITRELALREASLISLPGSRSPAGTLVDRAVADKADLLIVMSHPQKDLSLLPHRSLMHQVLSHSPISVLCVPEPDIEPPHHAARAPGQQLQEEVSFDSARNGATRNHGDTR